MALPRPPAENVLPDLKPAGRENRLLGLGFSILAYFLFGSSDAIVKLLVQKYSIMQLIASQVVFALIPVAGIVYAIGGLRKPHRKNLPLLALRGFLAGFGGIIGFFAFSRLPMADVYAIAFCTPLIVTVLSIPLLGEKVGIRRWAAVVVGFVGVMIMVRPGFMTLTLGHVAALVMAVTGAGTVLIMRHLRGSESPSTMVATVMIGLLCISMPALPFVFIMPTAGDLALSAASGLMMGCAQFCILRALSLASAATVAPMQYSMMIWGVLYGFVIFSTTPDAYVLTGRPWWWRPASTR